MNLNARVTAQITFQFSNNETFILVADETARDKVMQLKSRIESWGYPVHIETGTKLELVEPKSNVRRNS